MSIAELESWQNRNNSLEMAEKTGRNDPCPCGSGQKFKKCHGKPVANMPNRDIPAELGQGGPPREWKPFRDLHQIELQRQAILEKMFVHELALIDDCLALAARQVELLGDLRPSSVEDVAARDVSNDAFEFLYEAKRVLIENRSSVVFPIMRRAFESVSLLHLFMAKPEFALKWSKGKSISNGDVRKYLEHDLMTESIEQRREQYKHFSQGTHPNRSHVPYMFLGEGNKFTLGAIHPIDPLSTGEHMRHLMRLCYWYVGIFAYYYRESLFKVAGKRFADEFLALTPRINTIQKTLEDQLARLHEKARQEPIPEGIGPPYYDRPAE